MSDLSREALRVMEDASHSGRLGPKSIPRLLALVVEMAKRIEKLERKSGDV